jgi:imidazolonepropionase-like amidohydrolase
MRWFLFAVVSGSVVLLLFQQGHAGGRDPQTIVLAHVRLIDGMGAPPRENVFIAIRDGKIVGITKDGTDVPKAAIMCATKTNAELLGIAKTAGTLTIGKHADLIVLDGNPLDDIHNTQKIVSVWHGGREVQPATMAK